MGVHKIKKGLDLPIAGEPEQTVSEGAAVSRVALVAADYHGMKPTMFVREGDSVKRGQAVFEDKKSPGTMYTAPGAGTVVAVNRGDKRALQTVVIELSESERSGNPSDDEQVWFDSYQEKDVAAYSTDEVRALLIESGLWTSFRTRPFSKVPGVDTEPAAIFITATDTNPLAPNPDVVVSERESDFQTGLGAIAKLREGNIYLCTKEGSSIGTGPYSGISNEQFAGPHPAGAPGTHIHTLKPAHRERVVWYIGYQDVIAIGALIATGKLDVTRVVSLAGPNVNKPRLIKTRTGASTDDLTAGQVSDSTNRVISGSVLSGRSASGEVHGFLGKFHNQISVIEEDTERELFGWLGPGQDKFSIINTFVSKLNRSKKFNFTSSTNGSHRAMVPIGVYEKVVPLDVMPTHLLRALLMGDVERAEKLGCLELDEEDVALCTFACPCKNEYGPPLREILTVIEAEG